MRASGMFRLLTSFARLLSLCAYPFIDSCGDKLTNAWTTKMSEIRFAPGSLPGTVEAQQIIWNHQHPPRDYCKNASFFIVSSFWGGIGGKIAYTADALIHAMNKNRILLLDYSTSNNEFCRSASAGAFCPFEGTFECYFENLSSCSLEDVYGADFVQIASEQLLDAGVLERKRAEIQSEKVQFQDGPSWVRGDAQIPSQLSELWKSVWPSRAPIASNELLVRVDWLRSQGTAYIARPNTRLRAELSRRRGLSFNKTGLPPGTVTVHVRHGDKSKETRTAPDEFYFKAANDTLRQYPGVVKPSVYIMTEDPASIEFFATHASSWEVMYTDIPRDNHGGSTPGPAGEWLKHLDDPFEEILNSFLNLDIGLEGDAFICGITSRWCDLLNRLRMTTACKANTPFFDINCESPLGLRCGFSVPVPVDMTKWMDCSYQSPR